MDSSKHGEVSINHLHQPRLSLVMASGAGELVQARGGTPLINLQVAPPRAGTSTREGWRCRGVVARHLGFDGGLYTTGPGPRGGSMSVRPRHRMNVFSLAA